MKQLWMNFLRCRLFHNLQAAAEKAQAWQGTATPEYAEHLAKQLMDMQFQRTAKDSSLF